MSFILDALRKSETDRQQRGTAEFASVPVSSPRRSGPPAWLWVVGALLVVNLAVLTGILVRPGAETAGPVTTSVVESQGRPLGEATHEAAGSRQPAGNDFASKVASARENAPPREEPAVVAETRPEPAVRQPSVSIARTPVNTASLPTIQQLQADGTLVLPELHVDIHVYSENPGDRFVFINMVKHKEGSQLAEGPLVKEITPDGVVLTHTGTTFLLPRE